jgi:hypothetical protein
MSAILQFEVLRERSDKFKKDESGYMTHQLVFRLARMALLDTFDNYGTFVLVSSPEKITIVQRENATDLGET